MSSSLGELFDEDNDAKWLALEQRLRVLGRYKTFHGDFYVITE